MLPMDWEHFEDGSPSKGILMVQTRKMCQWMSLQTQLCNSVCVHPSCADSYSRPAVLQTNCLIISCSPLKASHVIRTTNLSWCVWERQSDPMTAALGRLHMCSGVASSPPGLYFIHSHTHGQWTSFLSVWPQFNKAGAIFRSVTELSSASWLHLLPNLHSKKAKGEMVMWG